MVLSPVEVFAWQLNFLPQSGEPVLYSVFKSDKRSGKKFIDRRPVEVYFAASIVPYLLAQ